MFVLVLRLWTDEGAATEARDEGALIGHVVATRHCATDPTLAPVLVLHLAAAILLRPLVEMMPAIAGGLAAGDAKILGLLASASGAGALAEAVWMTVSPRLERLAWRALAGSVGAALGPAVRAGILLAGGLPCAIATLFVSGFASVGRASASLTLVKLAALDALRGRVAGPCSTILRGGTAIGAILFGLLADLAGLPAVLLTAACLCAAVIVLVARPLPSAPQ